MKTMKEILEENNIYSEKAELMLLRELEKRENGTQQQFVLIPHPPIAPYISPTIVPTYPGYIEPIITCTTTTQPVLIS